MQSLFTILASENEVTFLLQCDSDDDSDQRFIMRNSWGTGWGQAGYFTMPYGYLMDSNLSDDFWTIRLVNT